MEERKKEGNKKEDRHQQRPRWTVVERELHKCTMQDGAVDDDIENKSTQTRA
jgi:hypothetical protein